MTIDESNDLIDELKELSEHSWFDIINSVNKIINLFGRFYLQ